MRMRHLQFQDPVLLCFWLYGLLLTDYSGFLRLSLLASFAHECGHVLVYVICMRKMPQIYVSATGFCMKTKGLFLPPFQMMLLAAAGPFINFVLAGCCYVWLLYDFHLRTAAFLCANILLGIFNLLPIPPLDGAVLSQEFVRMLRARRKKG